MSDTDTACLNDLGHALMNGITVDQGRLFPPPPVRCFYTTGILSYILISFMFWMDWNSTKIATAGYKGLIRGGSL